MITPKDKKTYPLTGVTAQTLLKLGYRKHKIFGKGYIKYLAGEDGGRFHALFDTKFDKWTLHYDRPDKHGKIRYIRPIFLRKLAEESKIIKQYEQRGF